MLKWCLISFIPSKLINSLFVNVINTFLTSFIHLVYKFLIEFKVDYNAQKSETMNISTLCLT